jgi:hypothetical protein
MGQQEREQLSLLLVGFIVTRAFCRGPSELLLETMISQNDCSLEECWIDDPCRRGFLGAFFNCNQHIFVSTPPTCMLHDDTHYFRLPAYCSSSIVKRSL